MSQPHAIGVFDSGVGGLSVLKALRAQLPDHELIYVADSGNAPYGDRSAEFIEARADIISRFLIGEGVAALVIACNTASVVAASSVRTWSPVPVVAMEPAIKPAALFTQSKVIGVLATTRTLASDNVSRLIDRFGGGARILLQACPGLVEQVEKGELNSAATRKLLHSFVQPLLDQGADTLVLGCTHYPFLRPLIEALAGPAMTILDPAPAVARELVRRLGLNAAPERMASAARQPAGHERFYSTGSILAFQMAVARLWHADTHVEPFPQRSPNP